MVTDALLDTQIGECATLTQVMVALKALGFPLRSLTDEVARGIAGSKVGVRDGIGVVRGGDIRDIGGGLMLKLNRLSGGGICGEDDRGSSDEDVTGQEGIGEDDEVPAL